MHGTKNNQYKMEHVIYSINLIVNKKIEVCYYNTKIDKQGNFKGIDFFHIKDQVDYS